MEIDIAGRDLVMVKEFRTSPATLYAAWTDPGELAQWMGPEHVDVPQVEVDLRVGGAYAITIRFENGIDYTWGGRYLELLPPRRLSFTVDYYGESSEYDHSNPTVITVSLDPMPTGTRMIFRQSPFPPAVDRRAHADGWAKSFDKLEDALQSVAG